jgi:hypothetical protein
MENAGISYGHWEYFTVIWYILWPFGNVVVIWYIFPRFGVLCQEKSGSPVSEWADCSVENVSTNSFAVSSNRDQHFYDLMSNECSNILQVSRKER